MQNICNFGKQKNRCASAKKKTPTMEILPDKKELIMKGGTFQEQLSAFQ